MEIHVVCEEEKKWKVSVGEYYATAEWNEGMSQ